MTPGILADRTLVHDVTTIHDRLTIPCREVVYFGRAVALIERLGTRQ